MKRSTISAVFKSKLEVTDDMGFDSGCFLGLIFKACC